MELYLVHHGIKGQKWGIRRYQNEDGTLTEAGKARYGNKVGGYNEDNSLVRRIATGDATRGAIADSLIKSRRNKEKQFSKMAKEATNDKLKAKYEKKAEKAKIRREAQEAARANFKAYSDHTSTGKAIAQRLLLGIIPGSTNYMAARARGSRRLRSLLETTAGLTPIATISAVVGNKKAYGSALVLSAIKE